MSYRSDLQSTVHVAVHLFPFASLPPLHLFVRAALALSLPPANKFSNSESHFDSYSRGSKPITMALSNAPPTTSLSLSSSTTAPSSSNNTQLAPSTTTPAETLEDPVFGPLQKAGKVVDERLLRDEQWIGVGDRLGCEYSGEWASLTRGEGRWCCSSRGKESGAFTRRYCEVQELLTRASSSRISVGGVDSPGECVRAKDAFCVGAAGGTRGDTNDYVGDSRVFQVQYAQKIIFHELYRIHMGSRCVVVLERAQTISPLSPQSCS